MLKMLKVFLKCFFFQSLYMCWLLLDNSVACVFNNFLLMIIDIFSFVRRVSVISFYIGSWPVLAASLINTI